MQPVPSTPLPLPFTAPYLLAPMEGVTEPCFRELVLARNGPAELGGVFTEFARVLERPLSVAALRAHSGPPRFPQPIGLQLMGADPDALAQSVRNAFAAGAPIVDLNFGCPAKGALRTCAGAALLRDRARSSASSSAPWRRPPGAGRSRPRSARGTTTMPCSRSWPARAEAGGASLLTVHCRTRREGYARSVDWSRIARAVGAVSIPVCGNGGAHTRADLERMRRETGCAYAMAGQGALADPWIFSGRAVGAREAGAFLLEYADTLRTRSRFSERGVAGRVKQLLNHWTAGGDWLGDRRAWLRVPSGAELLERIRVATDAQSPAPAGADHGERAAAIAARASAARA